MGDRLIWTLFSAALLGAAGLAAEALAAAVWRRSTGRDPPKEIWAAVPAGRKAGVGAAHLLASYAPFMRH